MSTDFLESILSLVFPPLCSVCGEELHGEKLICSTCFADVREIPPPVCEVCGRPIKKGKICRECKKGREFDVVRGYGLYEHPLKEIIKIFKYRHSPSLGKRLARFLYLAMEKAPVLFKVDFITPVPVHFLRRMERGFNQCDVLAHELSELTGIPVRNVLYKKKITLPQALLSHDKRKTNLRGAFRVKEEIDGKRILLVDDVLTTGSTLEEAARVLKENGAVWVGGVVLAVG